MLEREAYDRLIKNQQAVATSLQALAAGHAQLSWPSNRTA
jgi:hypothetical protein